MSSANGNDDSAGFDDSADALTQLTERSANDHGADPKSHIHAPANHDHAHKWLSKFLPENKVRKIEARFHLGNYVVVNRQTGEKQFEPMSVYVRLGMHLLYYGRAQEKALELHRVQALLKSESEKMGKTYDSPESKAHIAPFIESFQLAPTLKDLKEPDPTKYSTFNEFFAREIREDARPIAEPQSQSVVSSPADSRLTAFSSIDLATQYWIKGQNFTLSKLLGDNVLAQEFDGGSIVIARLAPQDYHRWHSPVEGKVEDVKEISGTYFTVNPQAINEPGVVDVFCENKRSVMTMTSARDGSKVVLVAVGAMLVGSIEYMDQASPGKTVRRGQCLGKFLYGGSTVITLFPKDKLKVDDDLANNSTKEKCETLVRVGERIGSFV